MSRIDENILAALSSELPLEPLCLLAEQLIKEGRSTEDVIRHYTKLMASSPADQARYLAEALDYFDGKSISGDCQNGLGTMQWANGDVYTGQWQDGKQHGQGTYVLAADEEGPVAIYVGEFRRGQRNGQGISIRYPSIYIGEFKEDKQDGHGQMTWSNGGKYVGTFKKGKRHRKGTMYYPDGKVETQEWLCGELKGWTEVITE